MAKRNLGGMIQPLGSKVVVTRSTAADKTTGGLLLPDSAKEKPKRGTVQAVGPGKLLDNGDRAKPEVRVGNEVFFTAYGGHEIEINTEEFVILDETDILGILKTKE